MGRGDRGGRPLRWIPAGQDARAGLLPQRYVRPTHGGLLLACGEGWIVDNFIGRSIECFNKSIEFLIESIGTPLKTFPLTNPGVELVALYVKLLVSPLYKVWTWRSQVKPGLKLNTNLIFQLPFRADPQVRFSLCGSRAPWDAGAA